MRRECQTCKLEHVTQKWKRRQVERRIAIQEVSQRIKATRVMPRVMHKVIN